MNRKFGAHEMMELHEVLTDTIDGINQFLLYRPHVQDHQLLSILDNQMQFMMQEYNSLVSMISTQGGHVNVPQPTMSVQQDFTPSYGLRNPQPEMPQTSAKMLADRDVASGMLGFHKSSALCRMHAALEMADPQIRHSILRGANSCAEQAYELFQYMNQKGYYQVPTLNEQTTQTMTGMYQPVSQMNMQNNQMQMESNQYNNSNMQQ
jgi:spore coat protein CotF